MTIECLMLPVSRHRKPRKVSTNALLESRDLRLTFPDRSRKPLFGRTPRIEVLKGISLQIHAGESIGIVGESGSGKTSLGRTMMRLYRPTGGSILFEGVDITHYSEQRLRPYRARMQMIFQDPYSSLNPRHRIGTILTQSLWAFKQVRSRLESNRIASVLLERVGLPADFISRFPHELSGGERQRVGIARAVAIRPKLIVADEIVSGLDISAKAKIIKVLQGLKEELNLALIFISHDLAVVNHICDRVLVLRNGEAVESGLSMEVFHRPQNSYTMHLLSAIPLPIIESDWLESSQSNEYSAETLKKKESKSIMANNFKIAGCTALVTGANRGIGREFVVTLINRGATKVYACARNAENLEELVSSYPDQVQAIQVDITNSEQVEKAAEQATDVSLLINNAGINRLQAFIASADLSAAQEEMNTNYFGTLSMCRAFHAILGTNGGGAIVNVLSILARVNLPMMGSLCASKAAGLSLTQGVRAELAQQGTSVLAVMPGAVDTDMSRDFPPPKMPPSEVAEQTLDAIEAGQEELYCGDMAGGIAHGLEADPKAVEKEFAQYLPMN